MTEAHTAVIPAALAVSYSITLDKEGRRTMVLQGHMPIDAPQAMLHELADRMARTADRQSAVYELETSRVELALMVSKLHELDAQVETTTAISRVRWEEEKRKGEWSEASLSGKEKQALDGIANSRVKYVESIKRLQDDVARLERVVNCDGVHVGTTGDAGLSSS